jgi:hypothetical protein
MYFLLRSENEKSDSSFTKNLMIHILKATPLRSSPNLKIPLLSQDENDEKISPKLSQAENQSSLVKERPLYDERVLSK